MDVAIGCWMGVVDLGVQVLNYVVFVTVFGNETHIIRYNLIFVCISSCALRLRIFIKNAEYKL